MPQLSDTVLKAAKKTLKKSAGRPISLPELVTSVVAKVTQKQQQKQNDDSVVAAAVSADKVQTWIQESSKFVVDESNHDRVTLRPKKKKRDRTKSPHDPQEELVRSSLSTKRQKKLKSSSSSSSSSSLSGETTAPPTDAIAAWRTLHKIVVLPTRSMQAASNAPPKEDHDMMDVPWTTFEAVLEQQQQQQQPTTSHTISALIRHGMTVHGFTKPTPIQAQAWPILTRQRDMVGIAETGSGKTLAFALPALSAMASSTKQQQQFRRPPRMLVLAPTRELAMQSDQVVHEFGQVVGLTSLVVYGGVPKYPQTTALKQGGIDCIVATPGRLKDLTQEGSCDLSSIEYLVLDEADRMIDVGFEEDVRYIIAQCKDATQGRQTAMFSATWPAAIQRIAGDFMVDPIRVYVGFEAIVGSNNADGEKEGGSSTGAISGVDDSLSANKRVSQTVEVLEDRQREARLRQVLKEVHSGDKRKDRVLVFALYKKEAERLEYQLRGEGWNCCSIHGNKNQVARTAALEQFKNGSCPLLIATDVAARGLDIPNVQVVINYTFPLTIEDYVHRIGRTGRAGLTGRAITFFQPTDKSHAGELQQVMKQAGQEVPEDLLKFGSTIKKKEHKLYGSFGPRGGSDPMKKASKITFDC